MKHNGNVAWYSIFQVEIVVGCCLIQTGVVAVISQLFILRVIKLFKADVTLFCILLSSLQHIGKFCQRLPSKCFIQPLYLIFYVFYKLFHTVLASVHFRGVKDISIGKGAVCSSLPCMMPCLFSQSALYSSYPYTVHRLVLKYFQSLHTA